MNTKIFIHGLDSSNRGTKSIYFKEKFPEMIIPNFPGDLDTRMNKLNEVLSGKSGIKLVGSSFGGLMATLFTSKNESSVDQLILLAPAINYIESTNQQCENISTPTHIYHGNNDEVIPISEVELVAGKIFSNLKFNRVEDDHFLHNTFKEIAWENHLT